MIRTTGSIIMALVLIFAQPSLPQENGCARYIPYAYDAVSIRPMPDSYPGGNWQRLGGEGFISTGFSIVSLLSAAYGLPPDRIVSLPRWVTDKPYAITAKMDADNDTPVLPSDKILGTLYQLRLRSLLCQRFHLHAHAEKRRLDAYQMVLKDGEVNLTESTSAGTSQQQHAHSMTLTGATMRTVATALSNLVMLPVIDYTNLPGRYDLTVQWRDDSDGIQQDEVGDIRAALNDLGLALVPAKMPLEVLVVDAITPPSPN